MQLPDLTGSRICDCAIIGKQRYSRICCNAVTLAQPGLYVVMEWTGGFHVGHKRLNNCLSTFDPGVDQLTSRGGVCCSVGCCSIYYLQFASWCLDRSLGSQASDDPV